MRGASRLSLVAAAVVAGCACALALSDCGARRHAARLGLHSAGTERALQSPDTPTSLEDALAELEALTPPDGVDTALFQQLKDELQRQLTAKNVSKFAATAPTGESNRVNDLSISDNGDGTFTLSWHYRNLGDYDQDGTVGIADIIPLAEHFGEEVPEEDAERNTLAAVIDGSSNGRIGIEDVTPIAIHFAQEVHHYVIAGAESADGPWSGVAEMPQSAGTGEERLLYSAVIPSPAALWHRVVAYDAEGNAGEPSNAVLRPSNEPIIYSVTPTSGYQHEEYTFSAAVSGAEPRVYAWNFGGGADPDTSSDVSPTVTLSDAGEYAATLTVTNSDSSATFPFTLTVSERDMWAHTWGGAGTERVKGVEVDSTGCVYVTAQTTSFGAGHEDVLIMKYSSDGDLAWVKTWGGSSFEFPAGCTIANNELIVAGHTSSFGAGADDLFILRYDLSGNLTQQVTWGTADYERAYGLDVDAEGTIYIAGETLVYGGNTDLLLATFTFDGNVRWAERWSGPAADHADGVVVTDDAVYVCGDTTSFGSGGNDALLISFSHLGWVLWARTWGGGGDDGVSSLCLNHSGTVVAVGWTRSYGQGEEDALLLALDGEGNLVSTLTWGLGQSDSLNSCATDETGRFFVAGYTDSLGPKYHYRVLVGVFTPSLGEGSFAAWGSDSSAYTKGLVLDYEGNTYLGCVGDGSVGNWEQVTGNLDVTAASTADTSAVTTDISGVQVNPEGIETLPEGVVDSGGGGDDVLILKNFPR